MKRITLLGFLALGIAITAERAPAQEGYDPLRQITEQIVPARLLIVQDATGSMAWDSTGLYQSLEDGADSTGRFFWGDGTAIPSGSSKSTGTGTMALNGNSGTCPSSKCSNWAYYLYYDPPSRLANMKNALGNTVSLVSSFTPPSNWQTYWQTNLVRPLNPSWVAPSACYVSASLSPWKNYPSGTYTCAVDTPTITWPPSAGGPWTFSIKTTQTYTKIAGGAKTTVDSPIADPGTPIHAYCGDAYPGAAACTIADFPTAPPVCSGTPTSWACTPRTGFPLAPSDAGTGAVRTFSPPADVIGVNKDLVRWGLVAFSTNRSSCTDDSSDTTNTYLVPIDTASVTQDVTTLEKYFWLSSSVLTTSPASIGLQAGGSTNTIGALLSAKTIIKNTFAADGSNTCYPPYGVILATDGLSNQCNPSNANWISPCGTCPGVTCCDGGSSSNDCPTNPSKFAAQRAQDIWNLNFCPAGYTYCATVEKCLPPGKTCNAAKVCTGSNVYCMYNNACQAPTLACTPYANVAVPVHPHTWVIGVSSAVGPCELDFIAYSGRTDAHSRNNDAGYDVTQDSWTYNSKKYYFLPQSDWNSIASPGTLPAPTYPTGAADPNPAFSFAADYDGPTGQYKWFRNNATAYSQAGKAAPYNNHGEYAFFAMNASAIADAFTQIVDATGTGDYATSAPTSGSGIGTGTWVVLPSAGFPSWQGHLYWFDIATNPATRLFDAADLTVMPTPANRKIYTWDSANNLVAVTAGNLATLQTIAGQQGLASPATNFTAAVVDFIRGNDGAGTQRGAMLGPIINVTPAIIGSPMIFHQHNLVDHSTFEQAYSSRRPIVWVGSDDGMLHAFDFTLGREELALLPPEFLPNQVSLYATYLWPADASQKGRRVTGQPDKTSSHIYGIANALRFADVYFTTDSKYHTIAFLTEGPGGNNIAAIDVTHPYGGNAAVLPHPIPADPNYDAAHPVTILWSVKGGVGAGQLAGLYNSWSIPALAATKTDTWTMLFGSGSNPASTSSGQAAPRSFTIDMNGGAPSFSTHLLNFISSPTDLVGNQAFADAVVFSTKAGGYFSDNVADLALQADLNGRIWYHSGTSLASNVSVGVDTGTVTPLLSKQQPLYYSPAVSGYGTSATGCYSMAFGSGSFYEKSAAVTGPNVGTGSNFIPSLYIAVDNKPTGSTPPAAIPPANIFRVPIAGTWQISSDGGLNYSNVTLGARTQLTSSPFIISPITGVGPIQAIFAVYDPDLGCNGHSYVLSLTVDLPTSCDNLGATITAGGSNYGSGSGATHVGLVKANHATSFFSGNDAGARAVSGLTSTGPGQFVAAVSGLGQGSQATILEIPVQQTAQGNVMKPVPIWWKEHK